MEEVFGPVVPVGAGAGGGLPDAGLPGGVYSEGGGFLLPGLVGVGGLAGFGGPGFEGGLFPYGDAFGGGGFPAAGFFEDGDLPVGFPVEGGPSFGPVVDESSGGSADFGVEGLVDGVPVPAEPLADFGAEDGGGVDAGRGGVFVEAAAVEGAPLAVLA